MSDPNLIKEGGKQCGDRAATNVLYYIIIYVYRYIHNNVLLITWEYMYMIVKNCNNNKTVIK